MRHGILFILSAFLLGAAKTCGAASDQYTLNFGAQSVQATVQGEWREQEVTVQWRENGRLHRQRLAVPKEWQPTRREDNAGMAGIIPFTPESGLKAFIVVLECPEYGIWEYRSPAIYAYGKHGWQLQNRNLWKYAFSNAGSFYTQGRGIYVWDIEYDPSDCHWCPQKFSLQRFLWRHAQLQRLDKRITHRKYQPVYNYELIMDGKTLSPDPLREFGLRWRWWGKRA